MDKCSRIIQFLQMRLILWTFLVLVVVTIIQVFILFPQIYGYRYYNLKNALFSYAGSFNNKILIKLQGQIQQNYSSPTQPKIYDLMNGVTAKTLSTGGPNNICPNLGEDMQLLIAICSAPDHPEARMAIRQTWGHYTSRRDIDIIFILGTTNNQSVLSKIQQEANLYEDMITAEFIDSYVNLTLKTLSVLQWVDNFCPKVSFMLKTDDDMFINLPELLEFIRNLNLEQRSIYGKLFKKRMPNRNISSHYFFSAEEYIPSLLPDFITGPAYLLPAYLAKELYSAALNYRYLKLEDVFISGIVAKDLNITLVHSKKFVNKYVKPCEGNDAISIHKVSIEEKYELWMQQNVGMIKCK